jgi:hypothetical protein
LAGNDLWNNDEADPTTKILYQGLEVGEKKYFLCILNNCFPFSLEQTSTKLWDE